MRKSKSITNLEKFDDLPPKRTTKGEDSMEGDKAQRSGSRARVRTRSSVKVKKVKGRGGGRSATMGRVRPTSSIQPTPSFEGMQGGGTDEKKKGSAITPLREGPLVHNRPKGRQQRSSTCFASPRRTEDEVQKLAIMNALGPKPRLRNLTPPSCTDRIPSSSPSSPPNTRQPKSELLRKSSFRHTETRANRTFSYSISLKDVAKLADGQESDTDNSPLPPLPQRTNAQPEVREALDKIRTEISGITRVVSMYKEEIIAILSQPAHEQILRRITTICNVAGSLNKALDEASGAKKASAVIPDPSSLRGDVQNRVEHLARSSALMVDQIGRSLFRLTNGLSAVSSLVQVNALEKLAQVLVLRMTGKAKNTDKHCFDDNEVEILSHIIRANSSVGSPRSPGRPIIKRVESEEDLAPDDATRQIFFTVYVVANQAFKPTTLGIDFHNNQLLRREGGKLKVIPLYSINFISVQHDEDRIILSFNLKEQGASFTVYAIGLESVATLLSSIHDTPLDTFYEELRPKVCYLSGTLRMSYRANPRKKTYYVVLNEQLISFYGSSTDKEPAFSVHVEAPWIARKGNKSIVLTCYYGDYYMYFPDEAWRDVWFLACKKAASVSSGECQRLYELAKSILDDYGAAYSGSPSHQSTIRQLYSIVAKGSETQAEQAPPSSPGKVAPHAADGLLVSPCWAVIGAESGCLTNSLGPSGMLVLRNLTYLAQEYGDLWSECLSAGFPILQTASNLTSLLADMYKFPQKKIELNNGQVTFEVYPLLTYASDAYEKLFCISMQLFHHMYKESLSGVTDIQKMYQRTKERLMEFHKRPAVGETPAIFDMFGVMLQ